MVAALFALHPINVESVAWIAERKNVLSMFFFLLALGAYHGYVRRPGIGRYAFVAFCFALGLMAKPQVITLPFVLLLWDYWPLQRMTANSMTPDGCASSTSSTAATTAPPKRINEIPVQKFSWLVLEKLPLLLLCAASSVLTLQAQRAGSAVASLAKYSLRVRLENALLSYARYLGKAVWPSNLAPMYHHPGNSIEAWQALAALLLLLAITTLVWLARRRRYLLTGWFWFLGTMVPMIGIVQVGHQAMADRYAYLPFIGVFIMICWGIPELVALTTSAGRAATPSPERTNPLTSTGLAVMSLAVLLVLALVAHRQLGYWSDNLALWSRVSQVIGPNTIAEERTGDELLRRGRPEAAMYHFMRALAIQPTNVDSNFAVAVYEQKQGDLTEAIERYTIVVEHAANPEMRARALINMSSAYRRMGDTARAQESLQAAQSLRR
jgi:tetratricopeptide (TPR) repeat protein